MNTKTSPRQRFILILFGIVLFFLMLESGLRLCGFIISSLQEHRNIMAINKKGTYRILCLGESTTQGQYPGFLEKILNSNAAGIKFSVIDKGVPGVTSSAISMELQSNIDVYHPDMVVTMMGVNDFGLHLPYCMRINQGLGILNNIRVYKFMQLAALHIRAKIKEFGFYKSAKNESSRSGVKVHSQSADAAKFENVSTSGVKDYQACIDLGRQYRDQGRLQEAEGIFKAAINLDPLNFVAYNKLGRLFHEQRKFRQAEEYFNRSLELNPDNYEAYIELGWLLREQGQFPQAESLFNKAIDLDAKNYVAYIELARLSGVQGRSQQAEKYFKKSRELGPGNPRIYVEMGGFYFNTGKFQQAEECFKKALEFGGEDVSRLYGALGVVYENMNKFQRARQAYSVAERIRANEYNPSTANSYQKIKEILDKNNIRLVCVQYPMRNIGSLKKFFLGKTQGVIFVDNEKIFKQAVRSGGYKMYFEDNFGGDFGHCTQKGNSLLAENIANTIIKEVFNK